MSLGASIVLGLIGLVGILVFALAKLNGKLSREQEQREADQRQAEARKADQERADEIRDKAAAAAASEPAAGSLAERLHRSGRGRTTKD